MGLCWDGNWGWDQIFTGPMIHTFCQENGRTLVPGIGVWNGNEWECICL